MKETCSVIAAEHAPILEFGLSLCKIVRSSVILLLPLLSNISNDCNKRILVRYVTLNI
jgi:hypothetical protein